MSGIDLCYVDDVNNRWVSAKTGELFPVGLPNLVLGAGPWSEADIAAWPTSGTAFDNLDGSSADNTSFSFEDYGSGGPTTPTTLGYMHEQAVQGQAMAALYRSDGGTGRLNAVIRYLDGLKDIRNLSADAPGQDRLELAWCLQRAIPTAMILGRANYDDADFDAFLEWAWTSFMDWWTPNNWGASFAAARLLIASYLEDTAKWDIAVTYAEWTVSRNIFHSTYDGGSVNPVYTFGYVGDGSTVLADKYTGTPDSSATRQTWFRGSSGWDYDADYEGDSYPDGFNCEDMRDLSHSMMSYISWSYCLLTMQNCNHQPSDEFIARVSAGILVASERLNGWVVNSKGTNYPTYLPPISGNYSSDYVDGAVNWRLGWPIVARWWLTQYPELPANVISMLNVSDVTADNYANRGGQNHAACHPYMDGTLLPQLGATVYSANDIAALTTGTEYSALAARIVPLRGIAAIVDFGTTIVESDMAVLEETSTQIKGVATLYAADGDSSKLTTVTSFLDGLKDVTSWTGTTGQVNLEASWILINAVQAAQIIGYENASFNNFLDNVVPTLGNVSDPVGLDWWGSGNWNAGFAAARLHIASYRKNLSLFFESIEYLDYHIKRAIFHSDHDGLYVVAMDNYENSFEDRVLDTTPDASATESAWRNEILKSGSGPWLAEYSNHTSPGTWVKAGNMLDGTDNEAKRDLAHQMMSVSFWCMCEHVCKNVGYTLPQHITDRIRAFVEYSSARILYHANNPGSFLSNPTPEDGNGGNNRYMSWHLVARLYPGDIPADVASLLVHSDVTGISGVEGDLAMSADWYADGTLL